MQLPAGQSLQNTGWALTQANTKMNGARAASMQSPCADGWMEAKHGARAASMQSPCADGWMDAKHGARAT